MYLRKRNVCKQIKIAVSTVLMITLMLTPIFVQAKEESELSKSVNETTRLMESIFREQYERKEEEVKKKIEENGYDYTMTIQSFYDQGNPFQDMDYIDFIAKYASVKEYCFKNGIDMGAGLSSIDMIKMTVEEKEIEEVIPILYPKYEQKEDGYYYRIGNQKIEKETEVDRYEAVSEESNQYQYVGKEIVKPEKEILKYGSVKLTLLDSDVLLTHFGVGKDEIEKAYEKRKYRIDQDVNGDTLTQSVFVKLRQKTDIYNEEEIQSMIDHATTEQQNILKTAITLLGEVPYEWGGKATKPGYDHHWWTYDENGNQRGLDCSGFVQWVYMTCGYGKEITDSMVSTESMLDGLETISEEELEPGDIGLLNLGEETNHAGIYMGNGYYIHCASGEGTVIINQFPFKYFKKIKNNSKENIDTSTPTVYYESYYFDRQEEEKINAEDVQLLAQLIEHEAGTQGYNGWVAVGEVVTNRMQRYDKALRDIIYAKGQFSKVEEIAGITPRDDILSVSRDILCGRVAIFGNPDVLYFKNPQLTDGIAASEEKDWGKLKWYTSVNDHAFYTE